MKEPFSCVVDSYDVDALGATVYLLLNGHVDHGRKQKELEKLKYCTMVLMSPVTANWSRDNLCKQFFNRRIAPDWLVSL
jgi:hypothetical protein